MSQFAVAFADAERVRRILGEAGFDDAGLARHVRRPRHPARPPRSTLPWKRCSRLARLQRSLMLDGQSDAGPPPPATRVIRAALPALLDGGVGAAWRTFNCRKGIRMTMGPPKNFGERDALGFKQPP